MLQFFTLQVGIQKQRGPEKTKTIQNTDIKRQKTTQNKMSVPNDRNRQSQSV